MKSILLAAAALLASPVIAQTTPPADPAAQTAPADPAMQTAPADQAAPRGSRSTRRSGNGRTGRSGSSPRRTDGRRTDGRRRSRHLRSADCDAADPGTRRVSGVLEDGQGRLP